MEFVLSKEQIDNLLTLFNEIADSLKVKGVEKIEVRYEQEEKKFHLIIYYDKKYLLVLGHGATQTTYLKLSSYKIWENFKSITGYDPKVSWFVYGMN